MKRALIFASYVAIAVADVALGQHVGTVPPALPPTTAARPPEVDMLSRSGTATITSERVVITYGAGGLLAEHNLKFSGYRRAGLTVEMRGPCYSACTMLLTYVEPENLCIAPGAFMAFHAVRGEHFHQYMVAETRKMYETYPPEIRRWIDHSGGWHNLPVDGYWTMYDHSLWAVGYPRCAP